MTGELSEFCENDDRQCDLSFMQRWNVVCPQHTSSSTYFTRRNSCGGYSIMHFLGVDVSSHRYDYDAEGKLVDVTAHPFPQPCQQVKDLYGMDCGGGETVKLACDGADAG